MLLNQSSSHRAGTAAFVAAGVLQQRCSGNGARLALDCVGLFVFPAVPPVAAIGIQDRPEEKGAPRQCTVHVHTCEAMTELLPNPNGTGTTATATRQLDLPHNVGPTSACNTTMPPGACRREMDLAGSLQHSRRQAELKTVPGPAERTGMQTAR